MREPKTEKWLTDEGVVWRYIGDIRLSEIDRATSLANQGRVGAPLLEDHVERYAEMMRQGDEFPAIIVHGNSPRYVIIGGNHRVEAARRSGRTALDAYHVESTDPYVLDRMTRTANIRDNGPGVSKSEALAQAYWMHSHYNQPCAVVAPWFGLTDQQLTTYIRNRETASFLEKHGVNTGRIAPHTITRLAAVPLDEPRVAVAKLAERARLPEPEVGRLILATRAQGSEAAMLKVIEEWADKDEIKARIAQSRNGKSQIRQNIGSHVKRHVTSLLGTLDNYSTPAALQLTERSELLKLREDWIRLNRAMWKIFVAGGVGDGEQRAG